MTLRDKRMDKELCSDGGVRNGYARTRPLLSSADPSATHVVRSGVDECFVTKCGGARARCVRGPLRVSLSGGHLKASGWKPAFFAYFLCGGKESKCRPAQGRS